MGEECCDKDLILLLKEVRDESLYVLRTLLKDHNSGRKTKSKIQKELARRNLLGDEEELRVNITCLTKKCLKTMQKCEKALPFIQRRLRGEKVKKAKQFKSARSNITKWQDALAQARDELGITCYSYAKKGSLIYCKAIQIRNKKKAESHGAMTS